jgi:hypothetical protein
MVFPRISAYWGITMAQNNAIHKKPALAGTTFEGLDMAIIGGCHG